MADDERIRTVEGLYAAFARHDFPAILAALDADVEWGEPDNPYNPGGGTRHGHEGFLEWVRIRRDAEDVLEVTLRRFLTDAEGVAVVGFTRCRAKNTGREYATEFVHLIGFRGGKIVQFREFFDTFVAAEAFRSR